MDKSRLLYFMHVEKAGGTSVRHILSESYPPPTFFDVPPVGRMGIDGQAKTLHGLDEDVYHLISQVQSRQHRLACVAANLPFGIDKFLERPVTYFAFLREPVSRCVSYWYFAFQVRHRAPLWSVLESYDFDLRRILRDNFAHQFCNDQVRMVTGSPMSELGRTEFQMACNIIEECFLLAGALEHFEPCMNVLARRLGWPHVAYVKLNESDRSDASILPHGAVEAFREANEWDIRLYEWLISKYLPRRV